MKDRLGLFDNLKFILITLVIIGHLADEFTSQSDFYKGIFLFIYAFHMPLFIFISGLFFNNNNIKNKIIFYFSVGFSYKILTLIIERLKGNIEPGFSVFSDGGISWFMFALGIYTFAAYILQDQNKIYLLFALIVLALFAGYDQTIGDYLYLSRTIVFAPFYLLGTILDKKSIINLKEKYKSLFILAIVIIVIWGIMCFAYIDKLYVYRYLFTGRNPFYPEIIKFAPLSRLLCYFISFLTGFAILFITPSKAVRYITKRGQNSIAVYFWHWKFYELLKFFGIDHVYYCGKVGKMLFILSGVLISVILSQGYFFNFPIKQIKSMIYKYRTD